jgi:ketosteroid isomerase-like protein
VKRFCWLVIVLLSGVSAADDADDASAKVYEYFEVFNAKDISGIVSSIYSTPVHVGGGSGHRVLADDAAATENLAGLYEMLDDQGWTESVIENVRTCLLSDSLALVDTRYSRIDRDGNAIPPAIRTNLYVVQKIDGEWRIVSFYGHNADKRPVCERSNSQ